LKSRNAILQGDVFVVGTSALSQLAAAQGERRFSNCDSFRLPARICFRNGLQKRFLPLWIQQSIVIHVFSFPGGRSKIFAFVDSVGTTDQ
jgi:hypothetical protein